MLAATLPQMAAQLPEWGFPADADFFTVAPDDPSTVLGAGAFGAVFAATLRGLPAAAKTLHALQNPIMYGLVGPNADPVAVQATLAEFNAEAEALSGTGRPARGRGELSLPLGPPILSAAADALMAAPASAAAVSAFDKDRSAPLPTGWDPTLVVKAFLTEVTYL